MKSYKNIWSSLVLILLVTVVFFNNKATAIEFNKLSTKAQLPALELKRSAVNAPSCGIALKSAKALITEYLKKLGIKGDIKGKINVFEFTSKELWERQGLQIYSVSLPYASIDSVGVIKNNKVLCLINGMPAEGIFIADLNNDKSYELYVNVFFGSGIVSKDISGYDFVKNKNFYLSKRMLNNLTLFIKNKELWVKQDPSPISSYYEVNNYKLILKKEGSKEELALLGDRGANSGDRIFPVMPRKLTVELIGTKNKYSITDFNTISKIVETLNNIDYREVTKKEEGTIMVSSVGGIRLTADDNLKEQVYIHGAGGIYITQELEDKLSLKSKLCFVSKETINKLYEIIDQYVSKNTK